MSSSAHKSPGYFTQCWLSCRLAVFTGLLTWSACMSLATCFPSTDPQQGRYTKVPVEKKNKLILHVLRYWSISYQKPRSTDLLNCMCGCKMWHIFRKLTRRRKVFSKYKLKLLERLSGELTEGLLLQPQSQGTEQKFGASSHKQHMWQRVKRALLWLEERKVEHTGSALVHAWWQC